MKEVPYRLEITPTIICINELNNVHDVQIMSSKGNSQVPPMHLENSLLLSPLADFFVKGQCHEMNIFFPGL